MGIDGKYENLLNKSLKRFTIYAGVVLACSIPVYYFAISKLWQYELEEHHIVLTPSADREDTFIIIGAVTLLTTFFFVILLGGFVWLNGKISHELWQPFYKSLEKIKNFDLSTHREVLFSETDVTEFAELNKSLHKLINNNIETYSRQKEFADNASHELQTPLAIVQSRLEMLQQNSSLTEDQNKIIVETLHALARVKRINKNLLLLTRLENSQFMDKEMVNLSELLQHSLRAFKDFSENKEMITQVDIDSEVIVYCNRILVEIVINNLLTNAIRHSPSRSSLGIILSQNGLTITNSGLTPLKADLLFKRFTAASSQTPETGLGLAIIKQICARYDWNIAYNFEKNEHNFSIQLR